MFLPLQQDLYSMSRHAPQNSSQIYAYVCSFKLCETVAGADIITYLLYYCVLIVESTNSR